jgi:hypothetical protein
MEKEAMVTVVLVVRVRERMTGNSPAIHFVAGSTDLYADFTARHDSLECFS